MPAAIGRLALFDESGAAQGPLEWSELERAIAALAASGAESVLLAGPEPTRSPQLLRALSACRDAKLQLILQTDAHALDSDARLALLREAGLERCQVWFYGVSAATHDARLGKDAFVRSLRGVRRLRKSGFRLDFGFWLGRESAGELGDGLRLAKALGANSFTAEPVSGESAPSRDVVLDALVAGFRASAQEGMRLRLSGFETISADRLLARTGQTIDVALWGLLERGLLDRPGLPLYATSPHGDRAGLERSARLAGGVSTLSHALAAWCAPLVDLPPCLGGFATQRPERASTRRVKSARCGECPLDRACDGVDEKLGSDVTALLAPRADWKPDVACGRIELVGFDSNAPFESKQTYPGLMEELSKLGKPSESREALDERAATTGASPPLRLFGNYSALARNLAALQRDGGRAVVVDFHLLNGVAELRAACGAPEGPRGWPAPGAFEWWPANVSIVSCFPGYTKLYLRAGIPLDRISWRPYPIHLPLMPEAVPVLEATSISCGGNHLRDWATFDAAARLLPAGRPIDSFGAPGVMKSEGRAQYRGRLDLALFWAALAQSRFVVIPLEADWRRAAGITVMAMAQAVGRPIVCSRIKAAEDHLRDEEDSLLVAPGDAAALADAIRRLDEDDALCERLAAGARKNRDLLATKTLASMLVNGATLPDLAARRHALAPVDVW